MRAAYREAPPVASVALLGVAVLWALAAVAVMDGAHDYVSDGFCFKGEPGPRYAQAGIAVAGVAVTLVAAMGASRIRGQGPLRWVVAAAALLAVWLGVVVLVVAPFSFADGPAPLPAVYCTY